MDTKTILQCVKKNQQTLHLITVTDTRCTLSALLGDTKCACVASGMKLHTKKKHPRENHTENVTISLNNSQETCKSHAKLQLVSAVSATLQPLAELWGPLNLCVHEQHTSDAIVTSTQIIGNPLWMQIAHSLWGYSCFMLSRVESSEKSGKRTRLILFNFTKLQPERFSLKFSPL